MSYHVKQYSSRLWQHSEQGGASSNIWVGGTALIYLDHVSVMLEDIRAVYGIYATQPNWPVAFEGVSIQNAGKDRFYITEANDGISLSHIDIHGCRNAGLNIYYSAGSTRVDGFTFVGNGGDQEFFDSGKGVVCCFLLFCCSSDVSSLSSCQRMREI